MTSSALIESSPSPPLVELHRGSGCKLGGDATAVIGMAKSTGCLSRYIIHLLLFKSHFLADLDLKSHGDETKRRCRPRAWGRVTLIDAKFPHMINVSKRTVLGGRATICNLLTG